MDFRSSIVVIDSMAQIRTVIVHAINYQKLVSKVHSFDSLDVALAAIRTRVKADIVLLSAGFSASEIIEFIVGAKHSRNGRDGSYILISDEPVSSLTVAKNLIHGADGFLISPFTTQSIRDVVVMAEGVRRQNVRRRVQSAVVQILFAICDYIDTVACDLAFKKKRRVSASAHDASDILRSFNDEESEIYFDVLIATLEVVPAPAPIIIPRSAPRGTSHAIQTVCALIEELQDPHARVRAGAARMLGAIGPAAEEAVPYLMNLLKDQNKLCRDRAVAALNSIQGDSIKLHGMMLVLGWSNLMCHAMWRLAS